MENLSYYITPVLHTLGVISLVVLFGAVVVWLTNPTRFCKECKANCRLHTRSLENEE